MAKRVEVPLGKVDAELEKHAAQWVLVAVLRVRRPGAFAGLPPPEREWEEWRELYFEREAS